MTMEASFSLTFPYFIHGNGHVKVNCNFSHLRHGEEIAGRQSDGADQLCECGQQTHVMMMQSKGTRVYRTLHYGVHRHHNGIFVPGLLADEKFAEHKNVRDL